MAGSAKEVADIPRSQEPSSLGPAIRVTAMASPALMGSEMLAREDELKLLGFLATLAGLLGVVVAVSQFQVGSTPSETVRAYFAVILVLFMFVSAMAYLGTLQGKDVRQLNSAVLGYFAALLGLVVALALASLYPVELQFWGFWATALVVVWIFYWPLFRWHRNIRWNPPSQ